MDNSTRQGHYHSLNGHQERFDLDAAVLLGSGACVQIQAGCPRLCATAIASGGGVAQFDTNICIYLAKHQPPEVRERFASCFVGDVVISAVTLAELEFGIACSIVAAQTANLSALDKLIASHAVALGVTLVTNNEADFVSYAGLVVENWVNSH